MWIWCFVEENLVHSNVCRVGVGWVSFVPYWHEREGLTAIQREVSCCVNSRIFIRCIHLILTKNEWSRSLAGELAIARIARSPDLNKRIQSIHISADLSASSFVITMYQSTLVELHPGTIFFFFMLFFLFHCPLLPLLSSLICFWATCYCWPHSVHTLHTHIHAQHRQHHNRSRDRFTYTQIYTKDGWKSTTDQENNRIKKQRRGIRKNKTNEERKISIR